MERERNNEIIFNYTEVLRIVLTLSHEEADDGHAGSCVVIAPVSLYRDGT
jgi:hypothetical protein